MSGASRNDCEEKAGFFSVIRAAAVVETPTAAMASGYAEMLPAAGAGATRVGSEFDA